MNVLTRSSFDGSFKALNEADKKRVREAAGKLLNVLGDPHTHAGLGIRRIGEFFEFRAGLKLRVLFILSEGDAVLITVGDHDHIRRFIKQA